MLLFNLLATSPLWSLPNEVIEKKLIIKKISGVANLCKVVSPENNFLGKGEICIFGGV